MPAADKAQYDEYKTKYANKYADHTSDEDASSTDPLDDPLKDPFADTTPIVAASLRGTAQQLAIASVQTESTLAFVQLSLV